MGMETLLLWLAVFAGGYTALNIGANDVANAMGTSVGSKTLTLRQAIIIAMVCEFVGAVLVGTSVTGTSSTGIARIHLYRDMVGIREKTGHSEVFALHFCLWHDIFSDF